MIDDLDITINGVADKPQEVLRKLRPDPPKKEITEEQRAARRKNMERARAVKAATKDLPADPALDLAEPPDDADENEKRAYVYTKGLLSLGKSALTELRLLLKDANPRIRLQTALGVTRATVSSITKDTLPQGGGATIILNNTVLATPTPPADTDPPTDLDPTPHPRTGSPVTVPK